MNKTKNLKTDLRKKLHISCYPDLDCSGYFIFPKVEKVKEVKAADDWRIKRWRCWLLWRCSNNSGAFHYTLLNRRQVVFNINFISYKNLKTYGCVYLCSFKTLKFSKNEAASISNSARFFYVQTDRLLET